MKRYRDLWRGALALALLLPMLAACAAAPAAGEPSASGANVGEPSANDTSASDTSDTSASDTSASDTSASNTSTGDAVARPAGWEEASHGDSAEPNYAVVFPDDKVNQITITISPENWEAMQANLTELLGEPGARGPWGGFGGDGQRPQLPPGDGGFPAPPDGGFPAPPDGAEPPAGGPPMRDGPAGGPPPGGFGGGFGGFGGGDLVRENPMWVPATITFEGKTWTDVGVRYKGNSSLRQAWQRGSAKLPFKLDFDQFEDENPAIKNQRFYGFKQLSLSNNTGDTTGLRETIAYDLLEAAGLVAAETAFYEVVVDYGEGPVSLGLYTMVEVIDDTVVKRAFGDDSGNIYEAEGAAASLAKGTFDRIEDSFQKENNKKEADWSDIEELYNVLHSDARTSDPAAWRAELEAVFDVDTFLKWLALSAAIQHWDTYGQMSHNFYLYHDPATDKLTWISWDHNFILGSGGFGGRGGPGGRGGFGGRGGASLDKSNVGENWPLIRYLLDDPTYYERYIAALRSISDGVFDAEALAAKYQELAAIVRPYVVQESGEEAFDAAIEQLTATTTAQAEAVRSFLAAQP